MLSKSQDARNSYGRGVSKTEERLTGGGDQKIAYGGGTNINFVKILTRLVVSVEKFMNTKLTDVGGLANGDLAQS